MWIDSNQSFQTILNDMGTRLSPYLALYRAIELPNIGHFLFVILHCLNLLPDSQLKTRATSVDCGSP